MEVPRHPVSSPAPGTAPVNSKHKYSNPETVASFPVKHYQAEKERGKGQEEAQEEEEEGKDKARCIKGDELVDSQPQGQALVNERSFKEVVESNKQVILPGSELTTSSTNDPRYNGNGNDFLASKSAFGAARSQSSSSHSSASISTSRRSSHSQFSPATPSSALFSSPTSSPPPSATFNPSSSNNNPIVPGRQTSFKRNSRSDSPFESFKFPSSPSPSVSKSPTSPPNIQSSLPKLSPTPTSNNNNNYLTPTSSSIPAPINTTVANNTSTQPIPIIASPTPSSSPHSSPPATPPELEPANSGSGSGSRSGSGSQPPSPPPPIGIRKIPSYRVGVGEEGEEEVLLNTGKDKGKQKTGIFVASEEGGDETQQYLPIIPLPSPSSSSPDFSPETPVRSLLLPPSVTTGPGHFRSRSTPDFPSSVMPSSIATTATTPNGFSVEPTITTTTAGDTSATTVAGNGGGGGFGFSSLRIPSLTGTVRPSTATPTPVNMSPATKPSELNVPSQTLGKRVNRNSWFASWGAPSFDLGLGHFGLPFGSGNQQARPTVITQARRETKKDLGEGEVKKMGGGESESDNKVTKGNGDDDDKKERKGKKDKEEEGRQGHDAGKSASSASLLSSSQASSPVPSPHPSKAHSPPPSSFQRHQHHQHRNRSSTSTTGTSNSPTQTFSFPPRASTPGRVSISSSGTARAVARTRGRSQTPGINDGDNSSIAPSGQTPSFVSAYSEIPTSMSMRRRKKVRGSRGGETLGSGTTRIGSDDDDDDEVVEVEDASGREGAEVLDGVEEDDDISTSLVSPSKPALKKKGRENGTSRVGRRRGSSGNGTEMRRGKPRSKRRSQSETRSQSQKTFDYDLSKSRSVGSLENVDSKQFKTAMDMDMDGEEGESEGESGACESDDSGDEEDVDDELPGGWPSHEEYEHHHHGYHYHRHRPLDENEKRSIGDYFQKESRGDKNVDGREDRKQENGYFLPPELSGGLEMDLPPAPMQSTPVSKGKALNISSPTRNGHLLSEGIPPLSLPANSHSISEDQKLDESPSRDALNASIAPSGRGPVLPKVPGRAQTHNGEIATARAVSSSSQLVSLPDSNHHALTTPLPKPTSSSSPSHSQPGPSSHHSHSRDHLSSHSHFHPHSSPTGPHRIRSSSICSRGSSCPDDTHNEIHASHSLSHFASASSLHYHVSGQGGPRPESRRAKARKETIEPLDKSRATASDNEARARPSSSRHEPETRPKFIYGSKPHDLPRVFIGPHIARGPAELAMTYASQSSGLGDGGHSSERGRRQSFGSGSLSGNSWSTRSQAGSLRPPVAEGRERSRSWAPGDARSSNDSSRVGFINLPVPPPTHHQSVSRGSAVSKGARRIFNASATSTAGTEGSEDVFDEGEETLRQDGTPIKHTKSDGEDDGWPVPKKQRKWLEVDDSQQKKPPSSPSKDFFNLNGAFSFLGTSDGKKTRGIKRSLSSDDKIADSETSQSTVKPPPRITVHRASAIPELPAPKDRVPSFSHDPSRLSGVAGGKPPTLRTMTSNATGITGFTGTTATGARSGLMAGRPAPLRSSTKWVGGSFEIGGQLKEAQRIREQEMEERRREEDREGQGRLFSRLEENTPITGPIMEEPEEMSHHSGSQQSIRSDQDSHLRPTALPKSSYSTARTSDHSKALSQRVSREESQDDQRKESDPSSDPTSAHTHSVDSLIQLMSDSKPGSPQESRSSSPFASPKKHRHGKNADAHPALSRSGFALSPPPPDIDEKMPETTHHLMRSPSDMPEMSDAASDTNLERLQPAGEHDPRDHLLRSKTAPTPGPDLSNRKSALRGDLTASVSKLKTVTFLSSGSKVNLSRSSSPGPSGSKQPAPPLEVLSRTLSSHRLASLPQEVSNSAVESATPSSIHDDIPRYDDTIRQDRMLVQVGWTIHEELPKEFDDDLSRRYPMSMEKWEEFAVIWRRQQVELWCNYRVPGRQWLFGHKRLRHVIHLIPGRTHLSLYSSVDRIFCLHYQPDEKFRRAAGKTQKRAWLHFNHTGTNLFLFRARSSTIGGDWLFDLFRDLGGTLPTHMEVSIAGLDAKVKIPVPEDADNLPEELAHDEPEEEEDRWGEGYKVLGPRRVVRTCIQMLEGVREFEQIIEAHRRLGEGIALAWRRGQFLDWIYEDHDVDGQKRYWSVVEGVAFRDSNAVKAQLEMRPALHYPTTVRLPHRAILTEPPAVEGYITRIKFKAETRQRNRIYFTSHDGHLFICRRDQAFPPDPPFLADMNNFPHTTAPVSNYAGFTGGVPAGEPDGAKKENRPLHSGPVSGLLRFLHLKGAESHATGKAEFRDESPMDIFRRHEYERAFHQVIRSRGYINLRDIKEIRFCRREGSKEPEKNEEPTDEELATDPGGEQGLAITNDRDELRRLRSFEIIVGTGSVGRFEAHSRSVAAEWVRRLRALAVYWKARERMDAVEQMELQPEHAERAKRALNRQDDGTDVELDPFSPLLAQLYHWCIIDGCRSITHSGRLYVKRGLHKPFRERYHVLIYGHLLTFHIPRKPTSAKKPLPKVYHRRDGGFYLRDCYVYSGRLTAQVAAVAPRQSGYNPADIHGHRFPRIYPDGLVCADEESDCTFVVFQKRTPAGKHPGSLGQAGKTRIMRARSRLERDQWVFALNVEIERLVRNDRQREEALREFSGTSS